MNANEIKQHVREIVSARSWFSVSEIKGTHRLKNDLGLDSLDRTEVIVSLEQDFDIRISDEEEVNIGNMTVEQLSDFVVQKVNG